MMNDSRRENACARFPRRWLTPPLLFAVALTLAGCQAARPPTASQPTTMPFNQAPNEATTTSPPMPTHAPELTSEPAMGKAASRTAITAPVVGAMAPNIVLRDLEDNEVNLRDLRGKAVVLNFWASW